MAEQKTDRIRDICASFLNASRFPRIAYRNLVPHKHHDGIGVLDPMVQQIKLRWRWLAVLIVSPTILQQPQYINSSPPSNIDQTNLSLDTMLDLDLASIITSTSQTPFILQNELLMSTIFARNITGMSKVIAKDFFIIDLGTGLLRQHTDCETRYPRLLHADLFPIVETQMPFFIHLFESPKHLGFLIHDTLFPPQATTKLNPSHWNKLWRTSLPPAAHTV
ncbi:uncharacterized protein BX663DRAFT_562305 [Cokeromyces recurvatus]|uniref:uncharacterized protein n=1 Tax=Cokeromyces recurvatus TaxID=90255 RepID=UPI00222073AC|nr:uncharacterized protein BX663DRAFT_562305 [Cokeromyces recurvatus]KAI7901397.1 hypothetical protein BX663DRAFT_562305 [Cokeromyces recurvatus]